jgi:hypothetical protein
MYPETKGRTLEEIEEIFNQGHTFAAWKVKNDVGHKTLAQVKAGTHVSSNVLLGSIPTLIICGLIGSPFERREDRNYARGHPYQAACLSVASQYSLFSFISSCLPFTILEVSGCCILISVEKISYPFATH